MTEFRKLTERESLFVQAYIATGGTNASAAARAAGYASASAQLSGHKLLRRPAVLAAIREEAERSLKAGVALGAAVLADLAKNAHSETVRRQAAKDLLEHGGLAVIARSEHTVKIQDQRTDKELREHVARLARELGLEGKVIDGTLADSLPALAAPPVIDIDPDQATEGEPIAAPAVADAGDDEPTAAEIAAFEAAQAALEKATGDPRPAETAPEEDAPAAVPDAIEAESEPAPEEDALEALFRLAEPDSNDVPDPFS